MLDSERLHKWVGTSDHFYLDTGDIVMWRFSPQPGGPDCSGATRYGSKTWISVGGQPFRKTWMQTHTLYCFKQLDRRDYATFVCQPEPSPKFIGHARLAVQYYANNGFMGGLPDLSEYNGLRDPRYIRYLTEAHSW